MTGYREKFSCWVVLSTLLHGALFSMVLFMGWLFPLYGDPQWGSSTGADGGVNVQIVTSISGIPLPAPEVVQENTVANESKGFYQTEPQPEPSEPEKAELIPDPKASVRAAPRREAARAAKSQEPEPQPPNAVPFGQGGRPAINYGEFSTGAGSGGIGFGDGAFGDRYGWYVRAITQRISQNWLRSLGDAQAARAPRIYLYFEILRDGTIGQVELRQSSGIPSLDRLALRALYASNPLPELPRDFSGNRVTVSFWFEYSR